MQSDTLETIRQAEERLVNVWPAVSTLLMDGWVVRFANGYTGRANSASAVMPGASMSLPLIEHIETLYRQADLPASVRITPLAHVAVDPMLMARGYQVKDQSYMMVVDLEPFRQRPRDDRVLIEGKASQAWLNGVSLRQIAAKRSAAHLSAIVSQFRMPAAFASLVIDGQAIGFGLCAVDRGWAEIGSILMDAQWRGKGLGRTLVRELLVWAAAESETREAASRAFLQVDVTNATALALYESLGFRVLCSYRTLIKPWIKS